jgi:hypothetical protein
VCLLHDAGGQGPVRQRPLLHQLELEPVPEEQLLQALGGHEPRGECPLSARWGAWVGLCTSALAALGCGKGQHTAGLATDTCDSQPAWATAVGMPYKLQHSRGSRGRSPAPGHHLLLPHVHLSPRPLSFTCFPPSLSPHYASPPLPFGHPTRAAYTTSTRHGTPPQGGAARAEGHFNHQARRLPLTLHMPFLPLTLHPPPITG